MNEKLTKILEEAKNDDEFRKELIKTREQRDVMDSFCKVVTSRGYDMTVGNFFYGRRIYIQSTEKCKWRSDISY